MEDEKVQVAVTRNIHTLSRDLIHCINTSAM